MCENYLTMKRLTILLLLLPLIGFSQGIKPRYVKTDSIIMANPRSDTSTKVAVFDANGMIKYNYSAAGGSTLDTTHLSDRIDLKLDASDTSHLSDRINAKLNKADSTGSTGYATQSDIAVREPVITSGTTGMFWNSSKAWQYVNTYNNRNTGISLYALFFGDSMTLGYFTADSTRYPPSDYITIPAWNGLSYTKVNLGQGQLRSDQLDSTKGSYLYQYYGNRAGKHIAVVWIGINDLYAGYTAGQIYSTTAAFCNKLQAMGYKVIICTLPSNQVYNAGRNSYNRMIRAGFHNFADVVADLASDSRIGDDNDYLNSTYFWTDGLHLRAAGSQVVAEVIQAAFVKVVTGERIKYFDHVAADTVNGSNYGLGPGSSITNIRSGYGALQSRSSGTDNSAFGALALSSVTTGSSNTGIGRSALQVNTGGSNTATGAYALQANTTGANNSASGHSALYSLTSGNANAAFGYGAGRYYGTGSGANTGTSKCVFLGFNTRPLTASDTNEVVIGQAAVGNGSNTTTIGNSTVTDTYLSGVVHASGGTSTTWNNAWANPMTTCGDLIYYYNGAATRLPGGTANQIFAMSSMADAGCSGYLPGWKDPDWTTSGANLYRANGNIGLGSTSPMHRIVGVEDASQPYGFNFMFSPTNKNRTTVAQATDTSSINARFTAGGQPLLDIKSKTGTGVLTIDSTGKVGIGTTAPGYDLHVVGPSGNIMANNIIYASGSTSTRFSGDRITGYYNGTLVFGNNYSGANSALSFLTNNTEKARITNGGSLGIGTTSPLRRFHVVGSSIHSDTLWVGSPTGTYSYCIPGGNWVTSSTREIKKNIADYPVSADILTKITGVNPKTWNFKAEVFRNDIKLSDFPDTIPNRKQKYREAVAADSLQALEKSKRKHKGFIAEDISTITGKASKEVDQGELIMILWQANQALIRKVEDLESRVAKLEKK